MPTDRTTATALAVGLVILVTAAQPARAEKPATSSSPPTVVVAVGGPFGAPKEAFSAAHSGVRLAGAKPRDASPIYQAFFGNISGGINLSNQRAPQGWPDELLPAWGEAHRVCDGRRLKPTYTIQDTEAWLCAREVVVPLWQRYLELVGAQSAVVVNVAADNKERTTFRVRVEAYGVAETSKVVLERRGVRSVSTTVTAMTRDALAGKGRAEPRPMGRDLPKNQTAESDTPVPPTPIEADETVDVPAGCALPSKLNVRGPAEPSGWIAGAYEATVPASARTSPPVVCEVTFYENIVLDGPLAGSAMKSFGWVLRCDDKRTATGRGLGLNAKHAFKKPSKTAARLVRGLCSTQ